MAILNGVELRTGTALTAETGSITGFTAGNVVITGDLEVQGTQTIVDSTNVNIGDNIISVNATDAASGGLYVNHSAPLGTGSFIFDGSSWNLDAEMYVGGPFASFGSLGSTISSGLNVSGDITGSDVQIDGFSSVSASLAAISASASAPTTLDAVTDAGNTTTNEITVGGLTSTAASTFSGSTFFYGNIAGHNMLSLYDHVDGLPAALFDARVIVTGRLDVDQDLYVDGTINGSDVQIDGFSSVSASLAAISASAEATPTLDAVTDAGKTTTNEITVGGLDVSMGSDTAIDISPTSVHFGDLGKGITTYLTVSGDADVNGNITGSDVQINGFSSVSASLAAISASASAPATLQAITDAGNTTTKDVTVGGLTSTAASTFSGSTVFYGNIAGQNMLHLYDDTDPIISTEVFVYINNSTAITGDLDVYGGITGSDVQISGFSSVSASLAAISASASAPTTLQAVTDAGSTTTKDVTVGGLTSTAASTFSGSTAFYGNISGQNMLFLDDDGLPGATFNANVSVNGNLDVDQDLDVDGTITSSGLRIDSDDWDIPAIKITKPGIPDVFSIKYDEISEKPDTTFTSNTFTFIPAYSAPVWANESTTITNSNTEGALLTIDKVSAYGIDIEEAVGNPSGTGYLNVAGTATVGQLVETSARRFKDNIVEQESQAAKIAALKPVSYNWKDNGKADFGFIAEEVADIYPEFVEYNEEGDTTGVKYGKMVSVLVKAVQELQAEVAELKAKQ